MTRDEAVQAAVVLWGKNGSAERRRDADRSRRFVVGHLENVAPVGVTLVVRGAGDSYEAAFKDAAAHPEPAPEMPSLGVIYEQAKAEALADLRRRAVKAGRGGKMDTLMAEDFRFYSRPGVVIRYPGRNS